MAVGMSQPASTPVIGRDDELDSLRAFLDAVEQGPTALLLSGEPGIGKTVLWEEGVEEFRSRFGRVLSCRGVEAEASFAFAGLSELLTEVLDEIAPALAPPRRRALEVALLLADPGDQPLDAHMIGLALLDLVRILAESGPVLIAIDDLQWLDASSVAVLQVAVRRLRGHPVGILATVREAPDATVPGELERSFQDQGLTRLSLDPLSLGAVHHLLQGRLGIEPTRAELARVHETSGGNPFFALELARQGTGLEPGERLPVPDSLGALLGERLARLPIETRELLLVAAASGRPTAQIIATAGGRPEGVEDGLEPAVREGVIELEESRVRFTHPLLASICLEQATGRERRAVHRALAGAVADVEEQGRHLALAAEGPDSGVASQLDQAAEHAAARGAPAAAAELCELAAGLTPPGDAVETRRRRLDAAEFHRLAGGGERAAELLDGLLAEVPHGPERADILIALADTLWGDLSRMIELCDEALAEAEGDEVRSARILAYRAGLYLLKADFRPALLDARGVLENAERVGDPALLATAISRVGSAEGYAAEVTPGLLERGVEIEEQHGLVLAYYGSPRYGLARLRMRLGEIDRPRAALEDLEAEAAARGDEISRGIVLWTLSMLEWLAGRWQQALRHAEVADELTEQTQHTHARVWAGRVKTLVEADLGLVDDARASAKEGLALTRATSHNLGDVHCLAAVGRLDLELGNLEAAAESLRELPGQLLATGGTDPTLPVWADAIETLITLGELERAGEYLESYKANARRLGSPYAVAGATRCRGLLAAAEGDLEAAVDAYESSLAELEPLTCPLERGRTLLCLGSAHRQAKQKRLARDALEQALAIFDELGGPLWAEKARAELRRISGRRRASEEELTEMEERVARLAAEGRSNKEIAAELFVSVHTVGAHLSHAYRKLGIKSRGELAGRLATPTGGGTTARSAAK
jgi:DNA-binding CsgD family transcriptional regulator